MIESKEKEASYKLLVNSLIDVMKSTKCTLNKNPKYEFTYKDLLIPHTFTDLAEAVADAILIGFEDYENDVQDS